LHQYCEMLLNTLWSLWLQYLWERKQPVK
jgi:hypothetical protein